MKSIFFYLLLALGAGNITKAGFSFTSKIPSGEGTYDLVFCLPIFVIQLPISYGSYSFFLYIRRGAEKFMALQINEYKKKRKKKYSVIFGRILASGRDENFSAPPRRPVQQ